MEEKRGKTDSREKIIEAAIEEFGEKGYIAASTNCISRTLGISKGLLFYHFKSKEQLFGECAKKCIDQLDSYMDVNYKKCDDTLQEIKDCCELRKKFFLTYPTYQKVLSEILFGSLNFDSILHEKIRQRYHRHTYGTIRKILLGIELTPKLDLNDMINTVINIMEYVDIEAWNDFERNGDIALIVKEQMKKYEIFLEILLLGIIRRD